MGELAVALQQAEATGVVVREGIDPDIVGIDEWPPDPLRAGVSRSARDPFPDGSHHTLAGGGGDG